MARQIRANVSGTLSNIEVGRKLDTFKALLPFAFHEMLKSEVYTAMPGIIKNYNRTTKRARVQGAIDLLRINGERQQRTDVTNVPVVFPAGGGFTFDMPLEVGDPVLLIYSMRNLDDWKTSYEHSSPMSGDIFRELDAIAIPGFGEHGESEVISEGSTWRSNNGEYYMTITKDGIEICTESQLRLVGTVRLVSPNRLHTYDIGIDDNGMVYGINALMPETIALNNVSVGTNSNVVSAGINTTNTTTGHLIIARDTSTVTLAAGQYGLDCQFTIASYDERSYPQLLVLNNSNSAILSAGTSLYYRGNTGAQSGNIQGYLDIRNDTRVRIAFRQQQVDDFPVPVGLAFQLQNLTVKLFKLIA